MRRYALSGRLHAAADLAIACAAGMIATVVFYPICLAAHAIAGLRPRERRPPLSPQNF